MTKRTNRSRGGLSPSRGPGRGLPAQTRVYSRANLASDGSPRRLLRHALRPAEPARRVTPSAAPTSKLPSAPPVRKSTPTSGP